MYNPSMLGIEADDHKVKIIINYIVSSRLPLNTWDSASKQQQILFCFIYTRQSIWVCVLAWPLNHMGEGESFTICSLVPDSTWQWRCLLRLNRSFSETLAWEMLLRPLAYVKDLLDVIYYFGSGIWFLVVACLQGFTQVVCGMKKNRDMALSSLQHGGRSGLLWGLRPAGPLCLFWVLVVLWPYTGFGCLPSFSSSAHTF